MTELIWDGKYGPDGKRTKPVRLALPFQDVETVNESAQTRTRMLDLWGRGQTREWRNRLIWGDKKYVLPSLLPEFAGKVNLIYIDPPFATGADFSFTAQIPEDPTTGDEGQSFVKQPSMIEQKAYRDTWGRGLDSYLQWFYEAAILLHELLAETGSIYVHCDHRVNASARIAMDEVFGRDNFINEIVWKRTTAHGDATQGARRYDIVHDSLLFYSKNESRYVWNTQYVPFSDDQIKQQYNKAENGRRYRLVTPTAKKPGGDTSYEWNGVRPPEGRYWAYSRAKMREMDEQGRLYYSSTGQPYIKYYLDERPGVAAQSMWADIMLAPTALERVGYPTQKPEALLDRIVKASSNDGDLVLDCFIGSGTTAAVAEKLNRRWIAADLGRFAIHTTRKRLLSIPEVRPFVVQNLGKYERQAWQVAEFGQDSERAANAQSRYRRFILDLYHADPLDGYAWLHGVKAGHFVHVGSVDAPVVVGDVRAIAQEFWKAAGRGAGATTNNVDVLGWDFAFEMNELGRKMAADANIRLAFKRIPREVLEKKAVDQGDIKFFELAALDVRVGSDPQRTLVVELGDFVVPPDDVPEDVQRAITHWSQLIDYWAVDWDYRDDTFHNEWQSYRTKKDPKLALSARHQYDARGSYTILVKVIDILGNDTTKSLTVEAL